MAHDPCHVSQQGHSLRRESTFVPSNWKPAKLICRASVLSLAAKQPHALPRIQAPPMLVCRSNMWIKYVDQNGSAAILAAKKVLHQRWIWKMPDIQVRKHTGRCHQNSNTGVSVAPQKGLMSLKFFKEKWSLKSRSQGHRFNLVRSIPDLQYPFLCGGVYIKLY